MSASLGKMPLNYLPACNFNVTREVALDVLTNRGSNLIDGLMQKDRKRGDGICCCCAGAHLISDSDEIHETGNGDEK